MAYQRIRGPEEAAEQAGFRSRVTKLFDDAGKGKGASILQIGEDRSREGVLSLKIKGAMTAAQSKVLRQYRV